jgi:hypothetical protein
MLRHVSYSTTKEMILGAEFSDQSATNETTNNLILE